MGINSQLHYELGLVMQFYFVYGTDRVRVLSEQIYRKT